MARIFVAVLDVRRSVDCMGRVLLGLVIIWEFILLGNLDVIGLLITDNLGGLFVLLSIFITQHVGNYILVVLYYPYMWSNNDVLSGAIKYALAIKNTCAT